MTDTTGVRDAVPTNEPATVTEARVLINDNATTVHTFIVRYLLDVGVNVHLTEALTRSLFGDYIASGGVVPERSVSSANDLLSAAGGDVVSVSSWSGEVDYSLERVVNGAPSFEFLVRTARMVDPKVLPREVIPSQEVVDAMLVVFHYDHNTV